MEGATPTVMTALNRLLESLSRTLGVRPSSVLLSLSSSEALSVRLPDIIVMIV
jgi:hypothetical protein